MIAQMLETRVTTHPGEILSEELPKPLGMGMLIALGGILISIRFFSR